MTVRTTNATGDAQQRLHVITSTPYQSRSQSANLDAVIIEILVSAQRQLAPFWMPLWPSKAGPFTSLAPVW